MGKLDAAIYCRISDDREGEGLGVERQEEDCRQLAERLELRVVHVFTDNDIGASDHTSKKKVRVQYEEMLNRARAGEFGTIIAYSNSRLTRRVREYLDLIDLHKTHKVEIRTVVSGDHNLGTADGRAVAVTLATWDAAEAERISERIKRANRQKALKGEPGIQHRRHFGFQGDAKTHNRAEAALIREAVADILKGASVTQIWRRWEEQGVRTTDGNAKWAWTPVHRVLFSWKTAGIRDLNGEPLKDADGQLVRGNWEPIISLEDRERALGMLLKRTRRGQRQGRWLLSGLLRCGICGKPLYGGLGRKPEENRYMCSSDGRSHLSITAGRLEEYLERVVYRYALDKLLYGSPAQQDEIAREWGGEARLATVGKKVDELMDAFSSDALSGEVVFPQIDKLEQERRELRRKREVFYAEQSHTAKVITTWQEAVRMLRGFHDEPFEKRQLALQQEVETVVIAKGLHGHAGRAYSAFKARVKINWREPHPEFNGLSAEEAAEKPLRRLTLPDPALTRPTAEADLEAESEWLQSLMKLPAEDRRRQLELGRNGNGTHPG